MVDARAKFFLPLLLILSANLFQACVTTRPDFHDQKVTFQTLLKPDDPTLAATIIVVGFGGDDNLSLCNGIYLGDGRIVTAGHCIMDGFDYFALYPVSHETKGPITHINMLTIKTDAALRHEAYSDVIAMGPIKNDIAVLYFKEPSGSLLKAAKILPAELSLPPVKHLQWQKDIARFTTNISSLVNVSYKSEKDKILKGVFLVKDTLQLIGASIPSHSLLLSLDPNTSIHQGVSGSGIFYTLKDEYYLVGIASHVFPGINLMSVTEVKQYREWLKARRPN